MDNFRLILIVLGIIIVAAIYFWDRYQSKHDVDKYRTPMSDDEDESRLVITTSTRYEDDISTELADLKNFMGDANNTIDDDEINAIFSGEVSQPWHKSHEEYDELADEGTNSDNLQNAAVDDETATRDETPLIKDSILILHIVAPQNQKISGPDLMAAAKQQGFEFGDMNIFHYHHDTDIPGTQALFSLVNMYEPGYFDLQNMKNFNTRGISIFANLANDGTASETFNSMLAVTKHTAELLGCMVWGPDRQPLTAETVDQIQNQLKYT